MSVTNRTNPVISTLGAITIGCFFTVMIFCFAFFLVSVDRTAKEGQSIESSQSEGVPSNTGEVRHINASVVTRYLYVLQGDTLLFSQTLNPGEDMSVVLDVDQQFVVTSQPLAEYPLVH
jgi:hypothetical protein